MIEFTKWMVVLTVNCLTIRLLFEIFSPKDITIYSINMLIDIIACVFIWRFVNWNFKSDERLGIKPGIELF